MAVNATAAQTYAALIDKQFEEWLDSSHSRASLKGVELFEHKTPSGMLFKVRNVSEDFLIRAGGSAGLFRGDVLAKGEAIAEDPETAYQRMTPEQRVKSLQFASRAVRYICVEPRITLEDTGNANAIPADAITLDDYASLVKRATPGGDEAPGLKTFRKKRR